MTSSPGVDGGHNHVAEGVLCAVAHHNLRGLECEAVLARELVGDGLAQRHEAGHGGVEGEVVFHGLFGSCLDMRGGGKIGLAHREVYDIDALSLELGAFSAT